MWNYTEKVMDHFLNPRNVGDIEKPDGEATVGNISCGDALKLSFKLDSNGKIAEVKFKTFGCGSAIASSSILTEMVKGKTLEDAEKITNKDIVDALGGLPEEKIHCSVMGMEALQAAIANYRGVEYVQDEDDHHGRVVCHCFGVTDSKIRKLAKDNNIKSVEGITNYCKAGGACGRCKNDIKEILDGIWKSEVNSEKSDSSSSMTFTQKVIKIQSVIDGEIRPMLERDGGNIEFIDLKGDIVVVKLKGRCAMCPSASVTLRNSVEGKLKEIVSPDLKVEELK
ncbi:MAG TPA: Fe-S cluster assembly protein NifU [Lentisphaeria bacterium]|nr:MAG: Fe-S cluster assembly protein NifU [Lentisphaerae bacterium GWF2_38_69]HBM17594.1 Fe-S cluster assembly protein NifU [Lentisphaeria bacterium]